jgi:hypothetical protein
MSVRCRAYTMELLQAELIQTHTNDMFGCEACDDRIVKRQSAWNYQQNHTTVCLLVC